MKTIRGEHPDLDAAEHNWIQFKELGEYQAHHGNLASELMGARGFECTNFPFQVWEIVGHDYKSQPCAVLRANQHRLEDALQYMNANKVLVYNRKADVIYSADEIIARGWS